MIDLSNLRGERVLVLGLGVHGGGAGVVRYLVEQGARVTATDLRPAEKLAEGLAALEGMPVELVLGEHREADVLGADLVVRNPAVPRESPWLALARAHGVPVVMEMTLFWERCPAPITAVTGSKGKSTTTTWAGYILSLGRPDTVVAGNLRVSALEALPRIRPHTPVVLELSSWQLEALEDRKLGPRVSCVTNISPDHLNRYSGMEAYAESKRAIYRYQQPDGLAVLNADDPVVRRFAEDCPGQVRWFGRERVPGAEGGVVDGDRLMLYGGRGDRDLVRLDELRLPGEHNALNALAAALLADANGAPLDEIREGLRSFGGLRDRMELVAEIGGVRYVNDTASTVPTSTVAALRSVPGRVLLIAGGASKGVPWGDLGPEICRRVASLLLLEGSATEALQTEVYERCPDLETGVYGSLQSAVEAAHERARPGDTVLLSPACASFGMFDNEFHRGEVFRGAVADLGSGNDETGKAKA